MPQENTFALWWAITGRIPGEEEDTCHIIRAATEPEARETFAHLMFDAELDPVGARKAAIAEAGSLGVYINSVVWSRSPIEDASSAPPSGSQAQGEGPFAANSEYVHGPARPSGSGFKEFVIKLPSAKLAAMTAETLNEFALAWSCTPPGTGHHRLQAALLAATEAGDLDELADHLHPDLINQFCDGVDEMEKSRLEKAQALGFATVEQMHAHQAWIKQYSQAHKAETAFQGTPDAQKIRDAAGMPASTWVSASCAKPD